MESMFKGLQHRSEFSPQNRIVLLSNFVAKRLKDSRLSLYLPIENPSKRHGASSQRKLKSHSIRMAGMRSKIHTCQPETVLLIASFWLDALLNNKKKTKSSLNQLLSNYLVNDIRSRKRQSAGTINGELKLLQNRYKKNAFEAKRWLYTTGKVIQHLFIIDLYT